MYILDTNSIRVFGNYYPDVFPTFWVQLARAVTDGEIGSVREARKELGALLLAQNRAEELRAEYRDILATLGQPAMGFVCSVCRQKLPEHVFRCPSCESWDTVLRE